jgi:hypothetical protein
LSDNKKIKEELLNIKNSLIDDRLKDANFDVLDLTEIVDDDGNINLNSNKKKASSQGNKSVEDLVREILKSELKKWLNKNLPAIVREVVDNEIKNIIVKDE